MKTKNIKKKVLLRILSKRDDVVEDQENKQELKELMHQMWVTSKDKEAPEFNLDISNPTNLNKLYA